MKRYTFADGQVGTVSWHARNAQGRTFGTFTSNTGAVFTVEDKEVRAIADVNQVTVAALQTAAGAEYLALSREDQARVAADFAAALAEDNCSAIEYTCRIGAGNLQAYADCLRASRGRA